MYSCSNRLCFTRVSEAWEDVLAGKEYEKPLWVIHNKIDMKDEDWEVSVSDGGNWSSSIGATLKAMSTRTGQGTNGFGLEVATRCLGM